MQLVRTVLYSLPGQRSGNKRKRRMKELWKGNLAIVEGAISGGADAYFGYPITPQNEVTEYMSLRMREEKRIFLQAESELGAINMVFGAALTGKKALTSSSSPGISLMQEGISYIAGAELPSVIINVQRGGPGLGNISGAQGDYYQAVKGGGHGDYRLIVFTPGSVQEMYEMTRDSFKAAFKYRNPVMILTDGILGQMIEPAEIDTDNSSYNKTTADTGWNLSGAHKRKPRMIRSLIMGDGALEEHNYKLFDKYKKMKELTDWEETNTKDADVILVGYGTSARINLDVCRRAKKEGLSIGSFRLKTAFPFPSERINELSAKADFVVTEMSMGQMVDDVRLSVSDNTTVEFHGKPGGGIPEADKIFELAKGLIK